MAGETENLKFRKPHMTFVDGYFYMFDDDTEMLLQKTDDGVTAFSYPFDTLIDTTVLSCEYDGINFWSMRKVSDEDDQRIIQRWRIENYVCKLKDTITLSSDSRNFSSNAFTVSHYHCKLSGSHDSGDTSLFIKTDTGKLPGELTSGMTVTIGPNFAGEHETINVQHVSGNEIIITDPLQYNYQDDDSVLFYNYLWLFNDHDDLDSSTGALYKLSAYTGTVIGKTAGGTYKSIKATTFSEITHFTEIGPVNSLMYVKASNLLFVNIESQSLEYYGSMAMDTIEDDEKTVIEVYDISVHENNLYRLQQKATYFGDTSGWSPNYNYQSATFNQLVTSVGMTASPNVIAANGMSTSTITAVVRDQFLQPIQGRIVYFETLTSSSGDFGDIVAGQEHVNTDAEGRAVSTFQSGTEATLVKLIARVNQ